jgi:hypothetical protein
VTAAVSALNSGRNYGPLDGMTSSIWGSLAVDVFVGGGVNFLLFGVLPAAVRRNRSSGKNLALEGPVGEHAESKAWVFGLVAAVGAAALIGLANPRSAVLSAEDRRPVTECSNRGNDRLCLTVTPNEDATRFSVSANWVYGTSQPLENILVDAIVWSGEVDCQGFGHRVDEVDVISRWGGTPSSAAMGQMKSGIQTIELPRLQRTLCED